jgi:NDP-sugar pyrophosphorylase family protein
VGVEGAGTLLEPIGGDAAEEAGEPGIDGPVLVGEGCELDGGARLDGPLVIGDGAAVAAGAFVKHSVLLPGAQVPAGAIVAGAIYGRAGALA